MPRLPATVSHRGRLISLPVVLSSAQNTIRSPAGAWALGEKQELLNNATRRGSKQRREPTCSTEGRIGGRLIKNYSARCRTIFSPALPQFPDQRSRCVFVLEPENELKQTEFSPCLAERTPVRGLLFDFPYALEFFLLSKAVCGEANTRE